MSRAKNPPVYYVDDMETTVYKGQTKTEPWAVATIPLAAPDEPEYVKIYGSIQDYMAHVDYLLHDENQIRYYHNVKFDGSFLLHFLLSSKYWQEYGYTEFNEYGEAESFNHYDDIYKMPNGFFTYTVSDKGQWYTIRIKNHGHYCEFRDSLKLMPLSIKALGKSFKTKHQKLEMEYEGFRKPNGPISDEERSYICNDVLVAKECLEEMFAEGHDKLTIGSCCMAEFKSTFDEEKFGKYNDVFPNMYEIHMPEYQNKELPSPGDWIRKAYKGGWCYVNPAIANKEIDGGVTCDVNSLYPSCMLGDYEGTPGYKYPIGRPTYFKGEIPEEALADDKYYFVHVRTRFYLKEGYLPTIQIKGDMRYKGRAREWLSTSDVPGKDGKYRPYTCILGKIEKVVPDLYLTMTDWEMLQEHYDLKDTKIIDGFYFDTAIGLFDNYITKYAKIKMESTAARRQIAKLFLNNLYGRMAQAPTNLYKVFFLSNNILHSVIVEGKDKHPGYIPIGAAITSYAREFTIKAAQANYDVFLYSDTDSIHLHCKPEEVKGAPEHPTKFRHWKYETYWDYGKFIRAKTYVEHVTHEDDKEVEKPYYNMKCAGMSDHVKDLFIHSVLQDLSDEAISKLDESGQAAARAYLNKLDDDELEFIKTQRTFDNFEIGLEIPGMLKAVQIPGGTLLMKSNYKMRAPITL